MKKFKTPWGYVISLGIAEGFEGSILVVKPGKEIKPHIHKKTYEWEIILEGKGLANNKRVVKANYNHWNLNEVHGYINDGSKDLKIFCITCPHYDSRDDILI